jgi:hypothetical protein
MKFQIRYLLYIIGLFTILASYIFWALINGSTLILIGGFIISLVALGFILSRDRKKIILIALSLGIAAFFIRLTFKDYLVGVSYNIMLSRNEKVFEKVNSLLISRKGDISYPSTTIHADSIFSLSEKQTLDQFLKETSVRYIRKDDCSIFYPVWGVPLEMDYGLFYFHCNPIPGNHFHHIKGNWYYDR